MGCKQYARMLGLSRGYPYILYLSLSKWDAAPMAPLFHKDEEIWWHDASLPPIHRLVAIHADISARATIRRFNSEMGIFRVVGKGDFFSFSVANPIAT